MNTNPEHGSRVRFDLERGSDEGARYRVTVFAPDGTFETAADLVLASGEVRFDEAARTHAGLQRGVLPFARQILATRRWLIQNTGLSEAHIGLIGFCMGGGFALAAGRGWGAVSTNYGDIPPDEVMRGLGPVIGCYGGRDKVFGKYGAPLEARLHKLGVECETHTFPTAGHAFLTNGNHPIAALLTRPFFHVEYNPEVAAAAWQRIFAFFDRHLE